MYCDLSRLVPVIYKAFLMMCDVLLSVVLQHTDFCPEFCDSVGACAWKTEAWCWKSTLLRMIADQKIQQCWRVGWNFGELGDSSGSRKSSQTRSLMLWYIVPARICFKPFCERATSCSLNVWTSFSNGRWKQLSRKWSLIISLANYLIWSRTAADIKVEFLIELWETSFQVLERCTTIWL